MHVVERIERRVHEFVGLVEVWRRAPLADLLQQRFARVQLEQGRDRPCLALGPDRRERVQRAREATRPRIHGSGVARRTAELLILAQARRGDPRRHFRVEPVARKCLERRPRALGGETEVVPLTGAHVQAKASEPTAHVAQQRVGIRPAVEHECGEPLR